MNGGFECTEWTVTPLVVDRSERLSVRSGNPFSDGVEIMVLFFVQEMA